MGLLVLILKYVTSIKNESFIMVGGEPVLVPQAEEIPQFKVDSEVLKDVINPEANL